MQCCFKKLRFVLITSIFVVLFAFSSFAATCPDCREDSIKEEEFSRLGEVYIRYTCPNGHTWTSADSVGSTNSSSGYSTSSDKTYSNEELEQKFNFLLTELQDTFGVESASDGSIFNTQSMVSQLNGNLSGAVASWGSNTLYNVFVGLGVFLLFVSFIMSFYNNSMNNENKTPQQYTRMALEFILAFFIIANVNKIASIIVNVFIWASDKAWSYGGSTSSDSGMAGKVKEIFYAICKNAELEKASVLGISFSGLAAIPLYIKFLIPWLVSLVGKFGILFAVIKCELTIFINTMLYPIAAHDCFDNIKHSNFMKYTKRIAASALELTIIGLVMIASDTLLSSYMSSKLSLVDVDNSFNIGLVAAMFSLCRIVVATSVSSSIATSVFGG